jgi:DNA-binding transcriptional MerR regulator
VPFVTSYKIDELAREGQVSPRTIRYYVQRGLLPAPAFHGKDTTYDRGHLLRLQVIKKLQEGHLPLDEIQAKIGAASEKELERILADGSASPPPKNATHRGGSYRNPSPEEPPSKEAAAEARERWERIHLMPGLELHVRSDAGADARRAALEIQSQYGQGSSRSS